MGFAVAGDGIDDEMLADAGHRMHLQLPGRTGMRVAGLGFGFLDIGEDLFATHQVTLAGLGQGNAPGGAVEQAGLQMGFKIGDRPRDVGGGRIQVHSRGSKAADLGYATKSTHVLQGVHGSLSK
ncbi:hypothetical protein D3C76_1345640 [compost metagenome]